MADPDACAAGCTCEFTPGSDPQWRMNAAAYPMATDADKALFPGTFLLWTVHIMHYGFLYKPDMFTRPREKFLVDHKVFGRRVLVILYDPPAFVAVRDKPEFLQRMTSAAELATAQALGQIEEEIRKKA